ncbi:MAG: TIGR03862 family flavoprotein [Rhizobiales bacterium]|nr:TIGR03862 family flavoprotein [Hyphomicrobiales bacterium]MBN8985038.1 TIGR03862 family flavoprotein [Hyphomicrobiales bacterium]
MTAAPKPDVAVIGAGPAGLMAAEVLVNGGSSVTVYDTMPSAGRKLLMAGRGGLNLTHSEPLPQFMTRYTDAAARLSSVIDAFPPDTLRAWSEALGQPTFIGSSGRVFPKSFKASPLLRAWLRRLDASGVTLALRHRWTGLDDDGRLLFATPQGQITVKAAATVLALGGASWPRLGSDGHWVDLLTQRGVMIVPLRPANCGFIVAWSEKFSERFAGQPLKNIELRFGANTVRGEAMIGREGIEGGAVYALASVLREEITRAGHVILHFALRPDLDQQRLIERLSKPRGKQSFATYLRKAAGLAPVAIGLLYESALSAKVDLPHLSPADLATRINDVQISLIRTTGLDRAISTAGGIAFDELDDAFMLRRLPGVFAAGEMLDWEAPTGGYLLQASFATGNAAGRGALAFIR